MSIFAIDPGCKVSGYVIFSDGNVKECGVLDNNLLIEKIKKDKQNNTLAIEMIASYGMAVGKEVFETVWWIGRFTEAWRNPNEVIRIYRKDVKIHLCNSMKAKDTNIRQALIDMLGEVGTKKNPGPLYGVTSHAWSALAIAVTCQSLNLS